MFAPPPLSTVSETVSRVLITNSGPYNMGLTPYMAEPADALKSRRFRNVVFLGPARTGKTVTLIDGWIARVVVDDPGDMLVVQASQDLARYYSKVRVKRMIQSSPEVRARLSPSRQDDNTYDKVFRSGMVLAFGWPSGAQLSGRDFRYVALTEYDAADDDIEGEGSLFALGGKRIETYLSAGKLLCESSVRREYTDAAWKPRSAHEAPPATGITGLYNAGTRKWFYWQCPDCDGWFPLHADVHTAFRLPTLRQMVEELREEDAAKWARERAFIGCPHCSSVIEEAHKQRLNRSGLWVPDGCKIEGGRVVGDMPDADTDSYQLSCVAAAYQTWRKILEKYARAIQEYGRTGSEVDIKSTVNLDQGRAYLPLAAMNKRGAADIMGAAEDLKPATVPEGVRFIVGVGDTQGRGFVNMHFGFGPGENGGTDWWVIDRSKLLTSTRTDASGEHLPMDPAAFSEDWDRLQPALLHREFPLAGDPQRVMAVRMMGVDSGGRGGPDGIAGVTERAYAWWRRLTPTEKRVARLVKGASHRKADRVAETWPKTASHGGASTGDVPVLMLNTHDIKDGLAGDMDRAAAGFGGAHLPAWMDRQTFAEFTAEHRTAKGWECPDGVRNEAFDLATYARALATFMGCDHPGFWRNPPAWAQVWDSNNMVRQLTPATQAAPAAAPRQPPGPPRRRSSYWDR